MRSLKIKDICDKGSSNLKQKDVEGKQGKYPVFGASGYISSIDSYHQDKDYIAIVKDGSGIGRVSLTSDLWTSHNRTRGFLSLTCHYVDPEWKLRKKLLAFVLVPSPHTDKHIAEAIHNILMEWNLDQKAFCLTLDNASSNEVCIRELMKTSIVINVLTLD